VIGKAKRADDRKRNLASMAERLRVLRLALYPGRGVSAIARELGVARSSWRNWEAGAVAPADVVLRVVVRTGVSPWWLLTGGGEMFSRREGRGPA
jgi:Bacteriophage CI repressor helix-turn-helix domain